MRKWSWLKALNLTAQTNVNAAQLISSGIFGISIDDASEVMIRAVWSFYAEHDSAEPDDANHRLPDARLCDLPRPRRVLAVDIRPDAVEHMTRVLLEEFKLKNALHKDLDKSSLY